MEREEEEREESRKDLNLKKIRKNYFQSFQISNKNRLKIWELFLLEKKNNLDLLKNDIKKLNEKNNNINWIIKIFQNMNINNDFNEDSLNELLETFINQIFLYYDNKRTKEYMIFVFRLIVLYHDPELCIYLDKYGVNFNFFYQWFINFFINIIEINVIINIYDYLIISENSFNYYFLSLSLLYSWREIILSLNQKENIRNVIDKIFLNNIDISVNIIKKSIVFENYTPNSFKKYCSFILNQETIEDNYKQLIKNVCLPISFTDVLNKLNIDNNLQIKIDNTISFLVIDVRNKEQYQNGTLPNSFHLDPEILEHPNSFILFINNNLKSKITENVHITFLGSNDDDGESMINYIILKFLQHNFKYISKIKGGYHVCHNIFQEDGMELLLSNHNSNSCEICQKKEKNNNTNINFFLKNKMNFSNSLISKKINSFSSIIKKQFILKTKSLEKNETSKNLNNNNNNNNNEIINLKKQLEIYK
jgi:rhodanese-related sulfurtransferase